MPLDFGKLPTPKAISRPTDPIALFQSLRVTDSAINDLWLAQGDALREWNDHRSEDDVAIVLNTGAGKTLVGLLAAQSIVNETNGQVVYACSSLQLVEQTAVKASGYGLNVTTYTGSQYSNDLYQEGQAPCVTTYHALINGFSRFSRQELSAIVFDDAHAAGHIIRDQFTLRISRNALGETFSRLVQLFRQYFTSIGQEMGYVESHDRSDPGASWLVPPFEVHRQLAELQRILLDASLPDHNTRFAWEFLRDYLDLCTIIVSGVEISITPPIVPVNTLPYFRPGTRRIYLSATLTAEDAFARSFGRVPITIVAPETTAGECERLILIPQMNASRAIGVQDVDVCKQIVNGNKCLILVPSRRRAGVWDDMASNYPDDVAEQVETFKNDVAPACLVLTARYDGIDLPGDTCRVLVIDDLPTGLNPIERYLWERLGMVKLLRSTVGSRVAQSFGRISRGMSDHGVVILTGGKLIEWILSLRNQALLPEFLQRQILLGIAISRLCSADQLVEAAEQCLTRDSKWLKHYQENMAALHPLAPPDEDVDAILQIAQAEVDFADALWARDYATAAKALESALEQTFTVSRATGAWHALWLGYCYELLGRADLAAQLYSRAHGAERNITLPIAGTPAPLGFSEQVSNVTDLLQSTDPSHLGLPARFDIDLASLDGTGTVRQTEAAIEALGIYLGMNATRPDNELGTGPDVLWRSEIGPALSMEAKTAKGDTSRYTKDDLGQLRDHRRWVNEQFGLGDIESVFIGPLVLASDGTNPDPDMSVIELACFRELRDRLRAALVDICTSAVPATAGHTVESVLRERGLLWPEAYATLPKTKLEDIA
jgi:tetratricopeptide (TPR) repeat protein